jgi:hypothetical protein
VRAGIAERDVVPRLLERTAPEEARVEVLAAQAQRRRARLREARARRALARDEDVSVAVVVEDPPHVPLEEVVEVVVPQVGQAPDPLAGVVEIPGAALVRPPLRVDRDGRRCWDHRRAGSGGFLMPACGREEDGGEEEGGPGAPSGQGHATIHCVRQAADEGGRSLPSPRSP